MGLGHCALQMATSTKGNSRALSSREAECTNSGMERCSMRENSAGGCSMAEGASQ
jgi:hypothetical protein